MLGDLAPMFVALVALEEQVSATAAAAEADDEMHVYPWRPTAYPELPAIYNWIDDGSVEVPDTNRVDDVIIITVSIAVAPMDPVEDITQLVRLTDHFRRVVDPALKTRPILPDPDGDPTAHAARRLITRTRIDEFDDAPVMTMEQLIRVELRAAYP